MENQQVEMTLTTDDIVSFVTENAYPMSNFQCMNFVVNSHVTTYRQVRQALMEVEARKGSNDKIKTNIRRTETRIKILEREIAAEQDELKCELMQIDLDELTDDLKVLRKRLTMAEVELERFAQFIKDVVPDNETLLKLKDNNEEEERRYWTARLGKQAAMDLLAMGRISQGNMEAITMMPESEQLLTLQAEYGFGVVFIMPFCDFGRVPV